MNIIKNIAISIFAAFFYSQNYESVCCAKELYITNVTDVFYSELIAFIVIFICSLVLSFKLNRSKYFLNFLLLLLIIYIVSVLLNGVQKEYFKYYSEIHFISGSIFTIYVFVYSHRQSLRLIKSDM